MRKAASPSHSVSGGPGAPATTSPCRLWPLLPDGPNPTCRPSVCHHSPLILGSFSKPTIPLASGHSMDWFLLVRHLPLVSASYSGARSRCSHQQETKQPMPWTGNGGPKYKPSPPLHCIPNIQIEQLFISEVSYKFTQCGLGFIYPSVPLPGALRIFQKLPLSHL